MGDILNRKRFVNTLSELVRDGEFPNLHFSGPHENEVQEVAHSIIYPHYKNRSLLLEIHILDNHSESVLVNMIHSFCKQQPVVAENERKRKLVVIHQQNEILSETFVHFLEDRMAEQHTNFVFLTVSAHITPKVLLKKMVTFIIHPLNASSKLGGVDMEDIFSKILQYEDDDTLADKILEWNELHSLVLPPMIYDEWRGAIVN